MIFGASNECFDHCLTCGKTIKEFEFRTNNGVCDACPRLTEIAPQFWTVINKLANRGDHNALETYRKYG